MPSPTKEGWICSRPPVARCSRPETTLTANASQASTKFVCKSIFTIVNDGLRRMLVIGTLAAKGAWARRRRIHDIYISDAHGIPASDQRRRRGWLILPDTAISIMDAAAQCMYVDRSYLDRPNSEMPSSIAGSANASPAVVRTVAADISCWASYRSRFYVSLARSGLAWCCQSQHLQARQRQSTERKISCLNLYVLDPATIFFFFCQVSRYTVCLPFSVFSLALLWGLRMQIFVLVKLS